MPGGYRSGFPARCFHGSARFPDVISFHSFHLSKAMSRVVLRPVACASRRTLVRRMLQELQFPGRVGMAERYGCGWPMICKLDSEIVLHLRSPVRMSQTDEGGSVGVQSQCENHLRSVHENDVRKMASSESSSEGEVCVEVWGARFIRS